MKESAIVRSIIEWAFYQPDIHLDRIQSGRLTKHYKNKKTGITKTYAIRLAQAGSADIWGIMRDLNGIGRAVFVECKIPGEEIDIDGPQQRFKEKVEALGGIHITANSIDDVVAALKPFRRAIQ